MTVNNDKYNRVMKDIQITTANFYAQYSLKPNTVLMNRDDYFDLLQTNSHMVSMPYLEDDKMKVMGMTVRVSDVKKVSVGYMEEIEDMEG